MNIENLSDAQKLKLFPEMLALVERCSAEGDLAVPNWSYVGSLARGILTMARAELYKAEQPTTQPIFDADGWREMGPKECPDRKFNDQVQYEHGESWATTMRMGERSVSKIKDALFVYSNLRYRTRRPLPQTEGK